ncbi:hypothetical protein [Clostridium cadaveris]|uniref:hypothetical protein n=1 Tax=Clostridium cadaveris TaxID=1529 RepID=UPI0031E2E25F
MGGVTTLFNTFAFPVALCILLLWFIYKKIWTRIETTLDRVTKTNQELSESNKILLEKMDCRITSVDEKVDLLINKIN